MKRVLVVLLLGVIFLLILGAVIFKAFGAVGTQTPSNPISPSATAATPTSLADFTKSCFSAYTTALANAASTNTDVQETTSVHNCFTPRYIAGWDELGEEAGIDPVLLTPIPPGSAYVVMSTSVIASGTDSSDVRVVLASGTQQKTVVAHLVSTNNAWWIDSVTPQ